MLRLIGTKFVFTERDAFTKSIYPLEDKIQLNDPTIFDRGRIVTKKLARILYVVGVFLTDGGVFLQVDLSPGGSFSVMGYYVYVYDVDKRGWIVRGKIPGEPRVRDLFWALL